jgi:hypothetical protein
MFWVGGGLLVFLGMVVVTQHEMTGRIDVGEMVNRDAGFSEFRRRNSSLEPIDTFSRTSLFVARDRSTGRRAMLDMAVVVNARVEVTSCTEPPLTLHPGAGDVVCFTIQDAAFVSAASFTVKARDSQVGQFYRDLFRARGLRVSVIQDSSRAVILEAEDEHSNTLARVSIRGSFDTARAFFAVTGDFRLPVAGDDVRHRDGQ